MPKFRGSWLRHCEDCGMKFKPRTLLPWDRRELEQAGRGIIFLCGQVKCIATQEMKNNFVVRKAERALEKDPKPTASLTWKKVLTPVEQRGYEMVQEWLTHMDEVHPAPVPAPAERGSVTSDRSLSGCDHPDAPSAVPRRLHFVHGSRRVE